MYEFQMGVKYYCYAIYVKSSGLKCGEIGCERGERTYFQVD